MAEATIKKPYSIDVMVTERCNAHCPHCINREYRSSAEIALADFVELSHFLSAKGYTQIRIMGGEPTIHPDFKDVVRIAQLDFPHVVVMTNGRSRALSGFAPRDTDRIVYNLNALPKTIGGDMLKVCEAGDRMFSVVFSKDADVDELVAKARRIALSLGLLDRAIFDVVIDLTEDLFVTRTGLQSKIRRFYDRCSADGIRMSIVSQNELAMLYPSCFSEYVSDVIGTAPRKICNRSTPGHIDANLYWRFCHAFPIRLGKWKESSWRQVCERAAQCCQDRLEITRSRCGACSSYREKCDGGCFALTKFAQYPEIEHKWSNVT